VQAVRLENLHLRGVSVQLLAPVSPLELGTRFATSSMKNAKILANHVRKNDVEKEIAVNIK